MQSLKKKKKKNMQPIFVNDICLCYIYIPYMLVNIFIKTSMINIITVPGIFTSIHRKSKLLTYLFFKYFQFFTAILKYCLINK